MNEENLVEELFFQVNDEPKCDGCGEYYAYCNCELNDDERSYL